MDKLEAISEIISDLKAPPKEDTENSELGPDSYQQIICNAYNQREGSLIGHDCPECKNKGDKSIIVNEAIVSVECKCMAIRRNIERIERSGLKDLLENYTFDKYIATEQWQKGFKESAQRFISDHDGKWFYIGGNPGAGKTHLCTAIVGSFLAIGKPSLYMLWRDEVVPLKAIVNENEAYLQKINQFKTISVLYIDDFFKTAKKQIFTKDGPITVTEPPTAAEIKIAFEILNYRYNNSDLITIISSERTVDELTDIDEAVGSRVFQRSKEYCLNIGRDKTKNYRLKPQEERNA